MKKILLATAAMAVLSTSSAMAATGDFYGKANIGWSKLDKIGETKSNNAAFVALGAGYYIMDNVRAELALDHFFNAEYKFNNDDFNVKIKYNINSLMLNSYVDLFDAGMAKIFAGAGVGSSVVSTKSISQSHVTVLNQTITTTTKVKNQTFFTYALHLGASAELTDGVHGELTYSYRDLTAIGKGRKLGDKNSLKGHHVAAGVRFDF